MATVHRTTVAFLLLLVLSIAAFAQGQAGNAPPVVTASASAGQVRYVSMGEVQQTRLQIFSTEGTPVFDSGFRAGNTLDWRLTDQQEARVADGSYIFLVTVKDFNGGLTQKYGTAVIEKDQVYLEPTRRAELSQGQSTALESSKQSEQLSPVDRIGAAGLNRNVTAVTTESNPVVNTQPANKSVQAAQTPTSENLAGTGTTNKVAKWSDNNGTLADSTIFDNGSGKVGIGTTNPQAALQVYGQNNGGITSVAADNDGTGANTGQAFQFRYGSIGTIGGIYHQYDGVRWVMRFRALSVGGTETERLNIQGDSGNVGIGVINPQAKLDVGGNIKLTGVGSGIVFPDGTILTTASNTSGGPGSGTMTGNSIVMAINDPTTTISIADNRLPNNLARLGGANLWTGTNTFASGLSANNAQITNVGNPTAAGDAVNKAYADSNFVRFGPGAEQLSVGDANGTATMVNLRGGSTCCSGPGGHTPAFFKIFQNGSFVATGNLGIGSSPMEGKGYRLSWHTYKGAFRSGYADTEWDDANVGFFSWAGGSNSTASGLYSLAFGDTNFARSTSSIVFGSGNEVKGAAGFAAGAGNRVCDTYGVALGNNARSGGPYIDGKCDPETFNIRGLASFAMGYNVTADQDHSFALGKFASNNGFAGTFIWSDGSPQASADTFRNTANNEFAARATGGFRFRTNLAGTTGCNLPAGSGVFNCTSSIYTKENFLMVSGEDVLQKLRIIPVTTWNYIAEGKQVRHIGPVAEDFFQAFRLGTGNTSIGVQDLAGVSLAAVKALDERTEELRKTTVELQQKSAEVEQLRAKVSAMEERMAKIEELMQKEKSQPQSTTQQVKTGKAEE